MRRPITEIEHDGQTYHLIPWFDQVLDFLEIAEDLTTTEYLYLFLEFFVREDVQFDAELFKKIRSAIFGESKEEGERMIDFLQDEGRIYAGFRQAYGIDLYNEFGKMHWQTFSTLLENLPSDTQFAEVVRIRARKVPKINKYNQEEVQELLRLKAKYRIKETELERKTRLGRKWASLWDALTKGSD